MMHAHGGVVHRIRAVMKKTAAREEEKKSLIHIFARAGCSYRLLEWSLFCHEVRSSCLEWQHEAMCRLLRCTYDDYELIHIYPEERREERRALPAQRVLTLVALSRERSTVMRNELSCIPPAVTLLYLSTFFQTTCLSTLFRRYEPRLLCVCLLVSSPLLSMDIFGHN